MKRILIAVPFLLLITGIWLLQAAYSYYFSENLSSPNSSNWNTYGSMTVHSGGGYSGVSPDVWSYAYDGAMLYQGSVGSSNTEAKMTIRRDPNNPGGSFKIYLNSDGSDLSQSQWVSHSETPGGPAYHEINID